MLNRSVFIAPLAVALLSFAAVARAEPVVVDIAGKSPQAVEAELVKAAGKVCTEARSTDIADEYGSQQECVASSVQSAELSPRYAPSVKVASNGVIDTAQR